MNAFSPTTPVEIFAEGPARRWLETEILPAHLLGSRWFGGKARQPRSFTVAALLPISEQAQLALIRVEYGDGSAETYQLPLKSAPAGSVENLLASEPAALVGRAGEYALIDAIYDADFRAALWERIMGRGVEVPASRVLKIEQSNSSVLYGERVFVKLFRKLEEGLNPDAEILRHLSAGQLFTNSPAYLGALEHASEGGAATLLAVAVSAVPNRGDAWSYALRELAAFYARVSELAPDAAAGSADLIGRDLLVRVAQLGTRTGELHRALALDSADSAFAPEPLVAADLEELEAAILTLWAEVISAAAQAPASSSGAALQSLAEPVAARARQLQQGTVHASKTRTHGDYHLGQVLDTGDDFVIIDFEGEPARSLAERRRKRSPLRDVAGMLRSFHYAAHAARLALPTADPNHDAWAEIWTQAASETFLNAWLDCTAGASFRPDNHADLERLLEAFLLEKVIYEIRYELNNRPAWLPIPVRGLQRLLTGK